MNQTELITVILGLVAVVVPLALSIMAAFMSHTHRKQVDELAWAIISVTETLKGQADRALAPYGPQLQPVHNALAWGQGLVDEPSDWVIKQISAAVQQPPEVVIGWFKRGITEMQSLTDGVPPTEGIPKGETAPENNIG